MGRASMLILTAVLCTLCLGVSQVSAQGSRGDPPSIWPVWNYPDPHSWDINQRGMCQRNDVSSVCDPNSIISPAQADALDGLITEVYRNTTCKCMDCRVNNHGYIIRVAIMPRMERIFTDRGNTSQARLQDAMMYSYILSTRWMMDGTCNETVLILYAKHDDILFTLTRPGARTVLADNDITRISVAVRHYFDDEETIAEGLMEMIRRYRLVFQDRLQEAFLPSGGTSGRFGG